MITVSEVFLRDIELNKESLSVEDKNRVCELFVFKQLKLTVLLIQRYLMRQWRC